MSHKKEKPKENSRETMKGPAMGRDIREEGLPYICVYLVI